MPRERYLSSLEDDPRVLDRLSRAGYPIGSVMGWGQGYAGRISHMISLIHYRLGGRACVVDNNFPGEYHWMPESEYTARWRANGHWAFILTRLPAKLQALASKPGIIGGGILTGLSGVVTFATAVVGLVRTARPGPEGTPRAGHTLFRFGLT